MEFPWTLNPPPFHYMLRASGQSEVWSDARAEDKFRQYGWRCSTSEDAYGPRTLIGNWTEQRRDVKHNRILRPLPSQFSHYFETTFSSSFQREEKRPISTFPQREPRSFPGHQPELDPPNSRSPPNSCYRQDYTLPSASPGGRTHTSHPPERRTSGEHAQQTDPTASPP